MIIINEQIYCIDRLKSELLSTESTTTTTMKSKNFELISYKMYDNDDDLIPIFERKPNSDYLQLSRMQRHTINNNNNRNNKRRRRRNYNNNNNDDSNRRHHNHNHNHNQNNNRRYNKISSNYSRQLFDSLRSSIIYSNLGYALPSMLNMKYQNRENNICKTVPFEQKIQHPGCKSRIVNNNYCFGNCNSFYIPSESNKTLPFQSRCTCSPRRYRWKIIRLRCPLYNNNNNNDNLHLKKQSKTIIDSIDYNNNNNDDDNLQFNANKISLISSDINNNNNGDLFETIDQQQIDQSQQQLKPILHTFQYKKIQIITKCRCQT